MEVQFDSYGRYLGIIAEAYINQIARLLTPHGLDRFHFPLLHIIEQSGSITQSKLCELTNRDKVSILRAVDYLENQGFVERKENKNDRRVQLLHATAKAKKIEAPIKQAISETNKVFFGTLKEEDKDRFFSVINHLLELVQHLPEPELIIYAEKRHSNDNN